MTVTNHFELRWVDGYGAVSDAPSELAVMIEELADRLPSSQDRVELAVRDVRLPDGDEARIGLLQLHVAVPSEQRPVAFLHAAVLPPGHRLDEEGWRALVARRYGARPEERIREIYEELAVTTKDKGKDRLRALEIRPDDLREVLGTRPSSLKLKLKKGAAAREAPEPAARAAAGSGALPSSLAPPMASPALPMASPAPPVLPASPTAGAPVITAPGGRSRPAPSGFKPVVSDELARGAPSDDPELGVPTIPMPARPDVAPAGTPGPQGTLPDLQGQTQTQRRPREAASDAPTTAPGVSSYGIGSGASAAISGPRDAHGPGAPAETLHRGPSLRGLATFGAAALLIVTVVGLAVHAWKLAGERDRLAEELARPRPEDPALVRALEELARIRQERDAAHQVIAELRAGAANDTSLQVCNTSLAEARTKLGIAEGRVSNLETNLNNSQNQLAAAAKIKLDAEARAASVLQERDHLAAETLDLKRANARVNEELMKKTGLTKALCDELRSSHSSSSKLLLACRGLK